MVGVYVNGHICLMLLISTVSENNPDCLKLQVCSSFKLSQMGELYHNFI